MGAGKIIEGLVDALGHAAPAAKKIKAYHVSPHDFDRFEWSPRVRGTGEGAQAYGDGLYFAESPSVSGRGGEYWNRFAQDREIKLGPWDTMAAMAMKMTGWDREAAIARLKKIEDEWRQKASVRLDPSTKYGSDVSAQRYLKHAEDNKLAADLLAAGHHVGPHTYEVDINADPLDLLDWDKPFSPDELERFAAKFDGTNPSLRRRIEDYGYERAVQGGVGPDGQDLMQNIFASGNSAGWGTSSRDLLEAGVPGIRYFDGNSRNKAYIGEWTKGDGGVARMMFPTEDSAKRAIAQRSPGWEGTIKPNPDVTRNYVIFDDSLVNIKDKYAGGGLIQKIAGAVAKEAPELARGASTARRAIVNIGLDINGGERLAPEEALAAIERFGAKPVSAKIAQSDTEPTLVVELDRALKPEEAHELSAALRQEAIAQVDETGVGDLHGPAADKWKPFNPEYFIAPDGSRLGQGGVAAEIEKMTAGPTKTAKAYKLFRQKDGKLYPLFVNANDEVPTGEWLRAEAGELTDKGQVKSKIGPLAYRPGWHAGDLPIATHIGGKSEPGLSAPDYRPDEQVWAEIDMADDVDWQSVANQRARITKKGTPDLKTAHITDQVPYGGHYRYKTNPNMTGEWLIGGDMRVNRVLTDDEVREINEAAGVRDLPRLKDLIKKYGIAGVSSALGYNVMDGLNEAEAAELASGDSEPQRYAGGDLVRKAVGALTKAADASGATVKRLYHGRAFHEPIKQLDPFISPNQLGIHLGDAETASMFAPIRDNVRPKDAGGRVIPLDVEIKNPLRLRDNNGKWEPDTVYQQLVDQGLVQRDAELESRLAWARKGYSVDEEGTLIDDENAPLSAMLEIQDIIRGLGHDGVVYKNRYEFPDEAVQSRAEMRDRSELNSMSDEEFAKEFPEARDSYIAFRREQLKSPFGDGPGVGFADGGPVQKFAGGNLVRKLGSGLVDFLDFSGVGSKEVRDSVINGTELRGDGRKFTGFFGDVTSGKSDKYKPHGLDNYNPAIELGPDAARFRQLRDSYSGNFDNHIKTSIPGFDETQNAVGDALLKTYGYGGADVLDIGSSEGALIKALSAASDGRIRTTGIDPNPDMLRTYLGKPQAPGSRSILSAFGGADDAGKVAWEEADGTPIPFFDPEGQQFDAAHEAMVFQFISNARKAQAERVKQLLKPKGIAIFEEKFGNPKAIFDANEAQKDLYKAQYYTPEQLEIKRKEVLNTGNDAVEGMTDLQVSQAEMEAILRDTFRNRAQFWDSGNFKGYVASDDARALEDFLNNLQPLDSQYATTKTPRGFADGGGVPSAEDIASMTHDTSYGTGRDMNYLETMGTKIPLGEMNYFDVDGERRMPGGVQGLHDVARMGVYGVPVVGPYIGTALDTTEAVATGNPEDAALALAFGPGGKYAKGAITGGLAYAADPDNAEAGVFGRLAKWAQGSEGRDAFNEAMKMSAQGAENWDIRARTKWFKDTDGHWKFWRPSQGGNFDPTARGNQLGDVYHDPFLYEQYPDMWGIGFRRKNENGAHWDEPNNEIVLGDTSSPWFNTPDQGGKYGTMIHEIYHAKSSKEGWPNGSSPTAAGKVAMNDVSRMMGMTYDPSVTALADALMKVDPGPGLSHKRYAAEVGEALARRETRLRDFGYSNLYGTTPANPGYLDMPESALFHPGENLDPNKYRELMKMLIDEQVARDMQAAAEPKRKR